LSNVEYAFAATASSKSKLAESVSLIENIAYCTTIKHFPQLLTLLTSQKNAAHTQHNERVQGGAQWRLGGGRVSHVNNTVYKLFLCHSPLWSGRKLEKNMSCITTGSLDCVQRLQLDKALHITVVT
jgi:hypothetical protein